MNSTLVDGGYTRCASDLCIYTKQGESGILLLLIWVDDCLIAYSSQGAYDELTHLLKEKYKIKELGEAT